MNITIVLQQMLVLFAMMLTGFVVHRMGWISGEVYSTMSRLVVNVFNPLLIINSVLGKSAASTGNLFAENLLLVILFYGFLFAASFLLLVLIRPDSVESPVYQLMVLFPNIGFMGIPLVAALLGSEYIIYVAIYMLGYNILIYTYGIQLAQKSKRNSDPSAVSEKRSIFTALRPVITNPGVITSVIALFIFFLAIPVATPIATFCDYMGNTSIPLSMFLIGCSIAASDLKAMFQNKKIYVFLGYKLLLVPILGALLIRFLPLNNMLLQLFVIMLSMPAGSLVVLITEEYGSKTECATNGVVLSTLFSILSIPLVSLFLQ